VHYIIKKKGDLNFPEFRKIAQVYSFDLGFLVQVTKVEVEVERLKVIEVEIVPVVDFFAEALPILID